MQPSQINTLSANNQFQCTNDLETNFDKLINTISYLLPAIKKERTFILFDHQIETRSLMHGDDFRKTLNSIKHTSTGKDIVQKWYLYTRNHCIPNNSELIDIEIHSNTCSEVSSGQAANIENNLILLSLGGSELTESSEIILKSNRAIENLKNAYSPDTIYPLTPRYLPSDKHRTEEYWANGVKVSPMPLNEQEAQELLLESIKLETDYWGYRNKCGSFYRYKRTHVDKLIFHGFKVEENEVPHHLIKKLVG